MSGTFNIDPRTLREVEEIRRLLSEAYSHWEENCPDLHAKSSEGAVSIDLPAYFWKDKYRRQRLSVCVYSYVMGPSRSHYFDDSSEALTEVRKWHAREMERDYSKEIFW